MLTDINNVTRHISYKDIYVVQYFILHDII